MSVNTTILNGVDVSSNIIQLDIWREMFTVGRCLLTLDDYDKRYWGTLLPYQTISISIDGNVIFVGRTDDILPEGLPYENDHPELLKIPGRGLGRPLASLQQTADYQSGLSLIEDIINAINTAAGTGLTYVLPGLLSTAAISLKDTYLINFMREICQEADEGVNNDEHLYYVDNAGAIIHFSAGSPPATGVTLTALHNSLTNNILRFNPIGEKRGVGVKNDISIFGRDVDDHWSEGDASVYDSLQNFNAPVNETTAAYVVKGQASIKAEVSGLGGQYFCISFPRYEYTTLDFSLEGRVNGSCFVIHDDLVTDHSIYVRIVDNDGPVNTLLFRSDHTIPGDEPRKIVFPLGANVNDDIEVGSYFPGVWTAPAAGDADFNWEIVEIGLYTLNVPITTNVWLDALSLPIQTKSIEAATGGEIASHGKIMHSENRFDFKSQIALDNYASRLKNRLKANMETLNCVVIGNTSLLYPGTSVTVTAQKMDGITNYINAETYRFQSLHHSFGDHLLTEYNRNYIIDALLLKQTV